MKKCKLMTFNEKICTPDLAYFGNFHITTGQFYCSFADKFVFEDAFKFLSTTFGTPNIYVVAGIYGLLNYYITGDEKSFIPTVFISLLAHQELEPIFHRIFDEVLQREIFTKNFDQVPLAHVLLTCLTCQEKRAKFLLSHQRLSLDASQGIHLIHYLRPNLAQMIRDRLVIGQIVPFPTNNLGTFLFINSKLIYPPDEKELFVDKEGKLHLLNRDVILIVASGGIYQRLVLYKATPIRVFPGDKIFVFSRKIGTQIPDTTPNKDEWITNEKKKIFRQFKNIYYHRGGVGMVVKFFESYHGCRILIQPETLEN